MELQVAKKVLMPRTAAKDTTTQATKLTETEIKVKRGKKENRDLMCKSSCQTCILILCKNALVIGYDRC